jgi:DNA-binding CsgD family transcriptional regulator
MHLQRYLDVSQATHVEAFQRRLISVAEEMDFGIVAAALVIERPGKAPTLIKVGNTPLGFEEASIDPEAAKRDPVIRRLKRLSVPFTYDQSLYVQEDAGDLWETQSPFGYRTGISVALHLPLSKHFLLGVDRVEPLPTDEMHLTRMFADLQLLAVHAQEAATRLLDPSQREAQEAPKLTKRETEVLKWTMEGKSAWAVAQILNCSEPTVNFHIRNILKKLDCSSKHQAALKAYALGLI